MGLEGYSIEVTINWPLVAGCSLVISNILYFLSDPQNVGWVGGYWSGWMLSNHISFKVTPQM